MATTHAAMALKAPDGTILPIGLAEWRALDAAVRQAIRAAHTADVLVRVEGSGLHAACPDLPYLTDNGAAYLPLHVIEYYYVRLMRIDQDNTCDLAVHVDPAALSAVERVAVGAGLDTAPPGARRRRTASEGLQCKQRAPEVTRLRRTLAWRDHRQARRRRRPATSTRRQRHWRRRRADGVNPPPRARHRRTR